MSTAIEIRRDGDEWIVDDGSARLLLTKPGAGIVQGCVDQWGHENRLRPDAARSVSLERPDDGREGHDGEDA
ncbi:hypothetical protein [Bosea beijingensis]|uniref:hypothetical protein n=1 Tax=Bosea beijingensis TaxID=3068632 RepID=UPI002741BE91|nr:hypothetical protein [Bosea sp. REN20]